MSAPKQWEGGSKTVLPAQHSYEEGETPGGATTLGTEGIGAHSGVSGGTATEGASIQQQTAGDDGLEDMTLEELKDIARDREITGFSTMKKQELIDAIREQG